MMKDIIIKKLHESFIPEEEKDTKTELKDEKPKDSNENKPQAKAQYERIHSVLKNDIFNHAAIIRQLWGSDDATGRSLFRKKLEREKMQNSDHVYEFSPEELSKISSILMSTASSVNKALK